MFSLAYSRGVRLIFPSFLYTIIFGRRPSVVCRRRRNRYDMIQNVFYSLRKFGLELNARARMSCTSRGHIRSNVRKYITTSERRYHLWAIANIIIRVCRRNKRRSAISCAYGVSCNYIALFRASRACGKTRCGQLSVYTRMIRVHNNNIIIIVDSRLKLISRRRRRTRSR